MTAPARVARPARAAALPAVLAVTLLVTLLGWQQAGRRVDAVTAERDALAVEVTRACSALAGLDLVDLVAACKAVGYQQVVMPEDLDR